MKVLRKIIPWSNDQFLHGKTCETPDLSYSIQYKVVLLMQFLDTFPSWPVQSSSMKPLHRQLPKLP